MNIDERIARLQSRHLAGRIIRNSWHKGEKTSDGYERACLLASFSPEVEEAKDASVCPADAMPPWLAYLTPYLDDRVSEEAWPSVVARYVDLLPKVVRLPTERLVRLDFETRAIAVREARSHTENPKVLKVIDDVLTMLDRASSGREVTNATWREVHAAAQTAAWAAEEIDAAGVEYAAAAAARTAAAIGTTGSQNATCWAADAGRAADAARSDKAGTASSDRMADAMLSVWESAIESLHVT